MSGKDTIAMLEGMMEIALTNMSGGSRDPVTMIGTRNGCALGFCLGIAERCHDHWDVPALREALREVATACNWALSEQQVVLDDMIMRDPASMARYLGMPETATAEEIMAEIVRRQNASEKDGRRLLRGDGDEKEPA